jgi:hypothetical protein
MQQKPGTHLCRQIFYLPVPEACSVCWPACDPGNQQREAVAGMERPTVRYIIIKSRINRINRSKKLEKQYRYRYILWAQYQIYKAVLWIRNGLMRIRIQPLCPCGSGFSPDPDPDFYSYSYCFFVFFNCNLFVPDWPP